jgi:hypothetical protein
LDAAHVRAGLHSAIDVFDGWLESAARVEQFVQSVADRTGRPVASREDLSAAVAQVKGVRQSAFESLAHLDTPPPKVPPAAIAEARELCEQGKCSNLGDVLARRLAGKT